MFLGCWLRPTWPTLVQLGESMEKRSTDLGTTTHVAGPSIQVGRRIIQRCLVCGEKLADTYDPDMFTFFDECEMVKEMYGFFRSAEQEYLSIRELPRDFCVELIER